MKLRRDSAYLAWSRLRNENSEETLSQIPTIASDLKNEVGYIRFALTSDRQPRLLLPISMYEDFPVIEETTALKVCDVTYKHEGKQVRYIDISCQVEELTGVFEDVAWEIMRRVDRGLDSVTAVVSTLNDFRELLFSRSSKGISSFELLGLMGELLLLRELLKIDGAACRFWYGPLSKRHDFRNDKRAIEVKTTSRPSNYLVNITSLDQLAAPSMGELYLAHQVLEFSPNTGLTFNSLLKEFYELSSNPADIESRLESFGIDITSIPEWGETSFSHESCSYYHVRDNFPRITEDLFISSKLPTGVTSLQYEIDLSMAQDYKLDNDETKLLIEGFSK
jgi:hypothetical protein